MDAIDRIEQDADAVLQLAGHETPKVSEFAQRRQRLLAALAAAADADVWMWTLQQMEPKTLDSTVVGLVDKGWTNGSQRAGWLDGTFSPEFQALIEPVRDRLDQPVAFTRSDLLDDAVWYASAFYNLHRAPHGLDDFLLAYHPAGGGLQSTVRLHRFHGRPAFDQRERDLVQRVVGRCGWLHDTTSLRDGEFPPLAGLSPRLRQVLALLLQGGSAKEIAADLDLSLHTVNDYMKDLHRHFGVRTRSEIMALFISTF